jgi:hypothetical protein
MRAFPLFPIVLVALVFACGGKTTSDLLGPSGQSSSGASGGTSSGGASSGVVTDPPRVDAGSVCPSFGKCSVSYRDDIVPLFEETSCSYAGCHAEKAQPLMPSKDPKQTWLNLSRFKNRNGLPYINPCSNDPDDSYILDNIDPSAGRASQAGVAMPLGLPMDPKQVRLVEKWVKCGAPNN